MIGPGWLEELNRRAAGKQTDYVRQEVAAAIQRQTAGEGVLVLPVLMGGAGMPSDLRGEIGQLSDHQAHTFQGNQADWDHQFVQLREAIARVGGVPKPRFRSPSEVEQPYHVLDDLLSFHFQEFRRIGCRSCTSHSKLDPAWRRWHGARSTAWAGWARPSWR